MYYSYSPLGTIGVIIYYLTMYVFSNAVIILELVGFWFTFRKMGMPGWKGIIPFYGTYVLFEKLWDTKMFWRTIIYLGVSTGTVFFSMIFFVIGGVSAVGGPTYGFTIVMTILGVLFLIVGLVFIIMMMVIYFKLYKKLAHGFGLKDAWAWGLLFLPYVFLPIIGFHKGIVYFQPVQQN